MSEVSSQLRAEGSDVNIKNPFNGRVLLEEYLSGRCANDGVQFSLAIALILIVAGASVPGKSPSAMQIMVNCYNTFITEPADLDALNEIFSSSDDRAEKAGTLLSTLSASISESALLPWSGISSAGVSKVTFSGSSPAPTK